MADPIYLLEFVIQMYDYNDWANRRYLAVAVGLPPGQLFHDYAQSWGSVYKVLAHVLNSEWIWLQRWQGVSPKAFPAEADSPTVDALRLRWSNHEGEMRRFIATQTPSSLMRDVPYTTTKGVSYTLKLWQMMVHVCNHGTHHRGELAAMFAMQGIPHPEEDWLLYFLERSGQ